MFREEFPSPKAWAAMVAGQYYKDGVSVDEAARCLGEPDPRDIEQSRHNGRVLRELRLLWEKRG